MMVATGMWGGDQIAATGGGDIDAITPERTYTEFASGLGNIEGPAAIPDDPARYGPLAGTILAGSGDFAGSNVFVLTAAGAVMTDDLDIGEIESIDVVPSTGNFYGIDLGYRDLLGAAATNLAGFAGEIVLEPDGYGGSIAAGVSGLLHLHRDGTQSDPPIPTPPAAGSTRPIQRDGVRSPRSASRRCTRPGPPSAGRTGPSIWRTPAER